MATEATTGVKWSDYGNDGDLIYRGDGFRVHVIKFNGNWWAYGDKGIQANRYAPDFATAKRDAERWILEREGRLPTPAPAPATDGGGWIACSERPVEYTVPIEIRGECESYGTGIKLTHWRPLPVDPHADAACLFDEAMLVTTRQIRAAARHVAAWIACKDAMPPAESPILEIIAEARYLTGNQWRTTGVITHWRLKRTDPHADAACLFGDERPTLGQARTAARHVAGCAECWAKLEEKGGA